MTRSRLAWIAAYIAALLLPFVVRIGLEVYRLHADDPQFGERCAADGGTASYRFERIEAKWQVIQLCEL